MAWNGFMIAAAGSGSGKTLITCGLLRLLSRRNLRVHSFKCGPDYIDPMFHSKILGIPCRNLDSYFTKEETLQYLYAKGQENRDIAVVEGVMGYYDGLGGTSQVGSSYALAQSIKIPAVLVVSCKGMSLSAAALVKGFLTYRQPSGISGVILNQVSERIFPGLKEAIERDCGVPVLGYIPTKKDMAVESRHLGLVTPDKIADLQQRMDYLAHVLEKTIDVDKLLEISKMAGEGLTLYNPLTAAAQRQGIDLEKILKEHIKIAIARDEAFSFLYEDNLNLLRELGAELSFFSPLSDKELPQNASGLILPGGYPEIYAKELSENESMKKSIKEAITNGMPTLAECGGFLYLHDTLEDSQRQEYPMVGVIPGRGYKTEKLGRFGYIRLTALKDQFFLKKGESIRSHEFHYWDSENCGADCHGEKASGLGAWDCVHGQDNLYAGFPHIYFYSNVSAALNLAEKCIEFSKRNKAEVEK